jgi:hypothetical protein
MTSDVEATLTLVIWLGGVMVKTQKTISQALFVINHQKIA